MKRTEGDVKIKERGTNLFGISAESKRVCIIADLGHETQEDIANAHHIAVTWNASKGMTTKQAGLYLEHGAYMLERMRVHCKTCFKEGGSVCPRDHSKVKCGTINLIAKMESE